MLPFSRTARRIARRVARRVVRSIGCALLLACASAWAQGPVPAAPPSLTGGGVVQSVTIEGHTLESSERLRRFLGLDQGAHYDDLAALRARVDEALKQLGYLKIRERWDESIGTRAARLTVQLTLEPAQVVRHVRVKGNWPVFDEDIRRRLTLRPGSQLPARAEVRGLLDREAARIKDFLVRDGYFDGDVDVVVAPAGRPEWVDLNILVHLGHWYKLGAVQGHGNKVLDDKALLGFFSSKKPWWLGRLMIESLRDDAHDVETEYRDRGYPAARVLPEFNPATDLDRRTGQARLRVSVTEKARVEIHFEGNRALTERQLRDKITIFATGSYDDVELRESVKELHRLYQSNGFLEAQVTVERKPTEEAVQITFKIVEGPELKVRRIDFLPEPGEPPLSVDHDTLHEQIATRVFPRIGEIGLGGGGYVTNGQLAQDVEKLIAFERSRGYPDVKVRGELARDDEAFGRAGVLAADVAAGVGEGMDLFVRFYIDEGHHEQVGAMQLSLTGTGRTRITGEAAPASSEREVLNVMALPVGAAYSDDAMRAALRRIPEFYLTRGHPHVRVDPPTITWNADHTAASIALHVDEGPAVTFGEILVRGNFKTAEWVVRRNLPFKSGDPFDVTRIALGERNLQTHGIFNGVRIVPLGLAQGVNPVPILVEVQQERYDNWGEFVASVGYSTDVGLALLPGWFWGNVGGGGGQMELRLEVAIDPLRSLPSPFWDYHSPFYRRLSASLRYVHPHLIWPSLRAEVAGFARKEDTVRLGEVDSAGASTSLSWVYSPRFRLFGRYEWTLSNLQSIEYQRLPGYADYASVTPDDTRTGKLTIGVVFDDRTSFDGAKNPLMPVEGTLVATSAAVASSYLGGSHDFFVASAQVQRYQPVGGGVILVGNLRGDWGVPLTGESALPAVDRFFAGGDVATRGFETDKLRTELLRYDVSPQGGGAAFRVIPQGGNIRFLGTVELQFPITTLGGFPWVGALFVDAGTIFDRPQLFSPRDDIKLSVGATLLRILTPVGPISLEYAVPLTQSFAEQTWKQEPWYRHWPGLIHFNWGIPILR